MNWGKREASLRVRVKIRQRHFGEICEKGEAQKEKKESIGRIR